MTPPLRSRVHRMPQLMGAYQRLLDRTTRAYYLASNEDERKLCRQAADALEHVLLVGRALFHGPSDPVKVTRRARKRPGLFDQ